MQYSQPLRYTRIQLLGNLYATGKTEDYIRDVVADAHKRGEKLSLSSKLLSTRLRTTAVAFSSTQPKVKIGLRANTDIIFDYLLLDGEALSSTTIIKYALLERHAIYVPNQRPKLLYCLLIGY